MCKACDCSHCCILSEREELQYMTAMFTAQYSAMLFEMVINCVANEYKTQCKMIITVCAGRWAA